MASTKACLAWAIPVHPGELGAHFEAYLNLQPTIQTLRLCNRFGKGDSVPITLLPIELVGVIEDYLMQEERSILRTFWARDFRCWESRCEMLDHFTSDQLEDIWHDETTDCYLKDECGEERKQRSKGLTEAQWVELEKFVDEFYDEDAWEAHRRWKKGWQDRLERICLSTTTNHALLRNFGLDVWISQSLRSHAKQAHRLDGRDRKSTLAYLVLPHAPSMSLRSGVPIDDLSSTQSACGLVLAPPSTPSEASSKRFSRAMKLLGLTPTPLHTTSKGIEDERADVDGEELGSVETQKAHEDLFMPQLRLLVSLLLEAEW